MKRHHCLLLPMILLLAWGGRAAAQSQEPQRYHTNPIASFNPDPEAREQYSGVTGYLAPDGREYALLGGMSNIYIVDVTDIPVRLVATIPAPRGERREICTAGEYAYAVNTGGSGLQIIDLSGLPANAVEASADSTAFSSAAAMKQEGGYLYVGGSDPGAGANGGVLIFDIATDPVRPQLVGRFTERRVDAVAVRNDTLYASNAADGVLSIVYLGSDRTSPRLVRSVADRYLKAVDIALAADGGSLTVVRGAWSGVGAHVWDIRDRENISKISSYYSAFGMFAGERIHIRGSVAMIAAGGGGTIILDVTDPSMPAEVGFFNAYGMRGIRPGGNLGLYPYLPSGRILASYSDRGLEIFTFDGTPGGTVRGVVRDAATMQPVPRAAIVVQDATDQVIRAADDGSYSISMASGENRFMASYGDYIPEQGTFMVEAGRIVQQDILLHHIPMAARTLSVMDDATGIPIGGFAYRTIGGDERWGTSTENPGRIEMVRDSSYTMYVGAWGYVPAVMNIGPGEGAYEVRLKKGYFDNAEVDQGWLYHAPGDDTLSAQWDRFRLNGGYVEIGGLRITPPDDYSPGLGDLAFEVMFAKRATLTSPVMDLSGYSDPYINCATWYVNATSTGGFGDEGALDIRISDDGGAHWRSLARLADSRLAWREHHFRLKDLIIPGAQVRFQIIASNDGENSVVAASFDQFSVTEGRGAVSGVRNSAMTHAVSASVAPNPVRGAGYIAVSLPAPAGGLRAELFDLLGRRVALLYDGALAAGEHRLPLDAASLAPGRYTWRVGLDDGTSLSGAVVVMR